MQQQIQSDPLLTTKALLQVAQPAGCESLQGAKAVSAQSFQHQFLYSGCG